MKLNRILMIPAWLIFSISAAWAQYDTGDAELNASLVLIDTDASSNFAAFQIDMSSNYNVAPSKIESWYVQLNLRPGDIYLVLEMGRVLKRPADEVVKVYSSNKKNGWGAIAKELGIKPGSAEFHALKAGSGKQAGKGKGKKHH